MDKKDPLKELADSLNELLREKKVDMPSIPESPGRKAYLRFLETQGYREEELLPVIDRSKVTPEMKAQLLLGLMQAFKSDDPKFIKAIVWMAYNTIIGRDNTNLIINELATALTRDFGAAGVRFAPCYAGVFPTDSFNAECRTVDDVNLVLLDTGCLEMAETISIAFLSKAPITKKVSEVTAAVDLYVKTRQRSNPEAIDHQGVSFGDGLLASITNAFEHFIIAHELGHLTLGHAKDHRIRRLNPRIGKPVDVVDKTEFQEFQADIWACKSLIDTARKSEDPDVEVPIAIAGPTFGIGTALLIEASARKHGVKLPPGHPPAAERLYMIQVVYELFGTHTDAYIARRFSEFLNPILKQSYPGVEPPPFLSRGLNKKLIPVLDSLNISREGARYINDFT
jgi:hypothetical protein